MAFPLNLAVPSRFRENFAVLGLFSAELWKKFMQTSAEVNFQNQID